MGIFLSVVIPAYNEANNLEQLIEELRGIFKSLPQISDYEVLIVDDHSSDGTFEKISALNRQDRKIRGIRPSRRSGSHSALRAGIANAAGDATFCLSADGQDNPHALPEMLAKMAQGVDLVWAIRRRREDPSFVMNFLHSFARRIISLIANPGEAGGLDLVNADLFLLNRKVTQAVNRCPERNTSLVGLLMWLGFRQDAVVYERRDRFQGISKWTFRAKWRFFKDWVIAFSGVPLKMISVLGLLMSGLGFLYAVFVVIYRLLGFGLPGWAEIVVLVLVIGGVQMLMLGVAAEYLWRNLDEARSRPLYFIEQATEKEYETAQN